MSLKPEEMTCRVSVGCMEMGVGDLGEPLPERLVERGRAWVKKELISGRKIRTQEQQQVIETCLFTTHPRLVIDIDWKITASSQVYTVRNVERLADRIIITGEADARHDRTGIKEIA